MKQKAFFYISFLFCASCANQNTDDCDVSRDCSLVSIDSNWVNLDVSQSNNGVPIKIWRGRVEDNNLELEDTVYTSNPGYYLPTDQRYSAEAFYTVGQNLIIALDSKKMWLNYTTNCGEDCYESDEITLDLELL